MLCYYYYYYTPLRSVCFSWFWVLVLSLDCPFDSVDVNVLTVFTQSYQSEHLSFRQFISVVIYAIKSTFFFSDDKQVQYFHWTCVDMNDSINILINNINIGW